MNNGGWDTSAQAWINTQGTDGDFGRKFVLDRPMLERVQNGAFQSALDIGCGEGRFCRLLQGLGIKTVGIDPTEDLIKRAQELDPAGDYRVDRAETLKVPKESFDLVVSYLSLIDIEDISSAIKTMVNALRPCGSLLIANLTSFNTAGLSRGGWQPDGYLIDNYLEERSTWVEWRGICIQNWHRPLSTYMQAFLSHGLKLTHFAEPAPYGGDPEKAARYHRVPYFHIMEWQKPEG